jgi:hypothetical protein
MFPPPKRVVKGFKGKRDATVRRAVFNDKFS